MITRNHLMTGLIGGITALAIFPPELYSYGGGNLIFLAGTIFGSIVPDFDEPNSKPSRFFRIKVISAFISGICGGHRGFTHLLFFPFLLLSILMIVVYWLKTMNGFIIFGIGMCYGIFLHQIGDLFTKSGIKGWCSISAIRGKKYREEMRETAFLPRWARFKVGERFESLFVSLFLFITAFFLVFYLFNDEVKQGLFF